jgi:hypothetical protein
MRNTFDSNDGAKRRWEAPVLTVLNFDRTAGTQEKGSDDPTVASFGGAPLPPDPKAGPGPDANAFGPLPPPQQKNSVAADSFTSGFS